MSVDPLFEIYAGMTPYHYCGNNPVNFRDPSGMGMTLDEEIGAMEYCKDEVLVLANRDAIPPPRLHIYSCGEVYPLLDLRDQMPGGGGDESSGGYHTTARTDYSDNQSNNVNAPSIGGIGKGVTDGGIAGNSIGSPISKGNPAPSVSTRVAQSNGGTWCGNNGASASGGFGPLLVSNWSSLTPQQQTEMNGAFSNIYSVDRGKSTIDDLLNNSKTFSAVFLPAQLIAIIYNFFNNKNFSILSGLTVQSNRNFFGYYIPAGTILFANEHFTDPKFNHGRRRTPWFDFFGFRPGGQWAKEYIPFWGTVAHELWHFFDKGNDGEPGAYGFEEDVLYDFFHYIIDVDK